MRQAQSSPPCIAPLIDGVIASCPLWNRPGTGVCALEVVVCAAKQTEPKPEASVDWCCGWYAWTRVDRVEGLDMRVCDVEYVCATTNESCARPLSWVACTHVAASLRGRPCAKCDVTRAARGRRGKKGKSEYSLDPRHHPL